MPGKMKNMMLVIPALHCGGAQRVIVSIAKAFGPEKYNIVIVPFADGGEYFDMLRPGIEKHVLNRPCRWSFFSIIVRLRLAYWRYQPEMVVSTLFYANIISCFARLGSASKPMLIVCEHGYHRNYLPTERFTELKKWMIKTSHLRAYKVVSVSRAIRDALEKHNGLKRGASVRIHNPVPIDEIKRQGIWKKLKYADCAG